jgi:hypothetical protein
MMLRKGTRGPLAEDLRGLSPLLDLARDATSGEVSETAYIAGRARFLETAEREVESRASRAPLRIAYAMAAVVALAAGGWGLQRWHAPEWTVEGAVASAPVASGSFVQAPATNAATIAYADGSAVVLSPSARVRVVRGEAHHVVLEGGRTEVRITRGHGITLAWAFDAGPFTVRAAQGGLAMAWSADGEQLDVWPHDAETTVQGGVAGAGVLLRGGDHLTARVHQGELRIVRADGAVSTGSTAEPAPPEPSSNAIVTVAPINPTATALPAAPAPSAPHVPWSALVARGEYDTVLRDADAAGIDGTLSRRPLADLAALADASRYRGQTELSQRALTAERSRFPGSKEAHTAAFLLGRLADDQSHDAARAIGWYDRYLAEAPTGPFASDALGRKMIAMQASQGSEAARPIAAQYARRFPHGAYAAQAEEIRTR